MLIKNIDFDSIFELFWPSFLVKMVQSTWQGGGTPPWDPQIYNFREVFILEFPLGFGGTLAPPQVKMIFGHKMSFFVTFDPFLGVIFEPFWPCFLVKMTVATPLLGSEGGQSTPHGTYFL